MPLQWLLSLPFVFYYNVATGIFSAPGDSRTPLFFLVVSSLSNIVAGILFVTTFQMGVAGMMTQFMIATFTDLILRVGLAFALSSQLGRVGIWLSWPMGWIVGTALSMIFYGRNFLHFALDKREKSDYAIV